MYLSGYTTFFAVWKAGRLLAPNKKQMWIPVLFHAPASVGGGQKRRDLGVKRGKNRVFADAPEPVPRVWKIGFHAMDDGVPVASFAGREILGNAMTEIPMAGTEQEAGEGGLSVAGVREELLGRSRHKTGGQIRWLQFARAERKRGEIGRVRKHETIFALFVAERLTGVDSGSAPSRQSAGEQSDQQENQGSGAVSERVVGLDAEEFRFEQARDG